MRRVRQARTAHGSIRVCAARKSAVHLWYLLIFDFFLFHWYFLIDFIFILAFLFFIDCFFDAFHFYFDWFRFSFLSLSFFISSFFTLMLLIDAADAAWCCFFMMPSCYGFSMVRDDELMRLMPPLLIIFDDGYWYYFRWLIDDDWYAIFFSPLADVAYATFSLPRHARFLAAMPSLPPATFSIHISLSLSDIAAFRLPFYGTRGHCMHRELLSLNGWIFLLRGFLAFIFFLFYFDEARCIYLSIIFIDISFCCCLFLLSSFILPDFEADWCLFIDEMALMNIFFIDIYRYWDCLSLSH